MSSRDPAGLMVCTSLLEKHRDCSWELKTWANMSSRFWHGSFVVWPNTRDPSAPTTPPNWTTKMFPDCPLKANRSFLRSIAPSLFCAFQKPITVKSVLWCYISIAHVWLGLGRGTTWLGSGKHGLGLKIWLYVGGRVLGGAFWCCRSHCMLQLGSTQLDSSVAPGAPLGLVSIVGWIFRTDRHDDTAWNCCGIVFGSTRTLKGCLSQAGRRTSFSEKAECSERKNCRRKTGEFGKRCVRAQMMWRLAAPCHTIGSSIRPINGAQCFYSTV